MHPMGKSQINVQHAIHPEPHAQLIPARLNVNIGCPAFNRVAQNYGHDLGNRRVLHDFGLRPLALAYNIFKRFIFFLKFPQRLRNLARKIFILLQNILKISRSYDEHARRKIEARGDKLYGLARIHIFRIKHTHVKISLGFAQRDHKIVPGGLFRDVMQGLKFHR